MQSGKREADLEALIEDLNAIVWEADASSFRFLHVSQGVERILGYPRSRWLEEENFWVNLVHHEDREWAVALCREKTDAGEDHEFVYRALHADGHIVWLRDVIRVIGDAEGRPALLRGVMTDISDHLLREQDLRASEERFRAHYKELPVAAFTWQRFEDDFVLIDANDAGFMITDGLVAGIMGGRASEIYDERRHVLRDLERCFSEEKIVHSEGLETSKLTGRTHYLSVHFVFIPPDKVVSYTLDLTERRHTERLLAGQAEILELIGTGQPLAETLDAITTLVEALGEDIVCSILLLDEDGVTLRHGSAPGLPDEYVAAIDGLTAGPAAGSCGTAAFTGQTVIVENIAEDPLWDDYRHLALPHGLQACWSTPIMASEEGRVLGTFAMYYRVPRGPSDRDRHLIEMSTHLAAIALERARSEESLKRSEKTLRELTENIREVSWLIDANTGAVLYISPAYETIWQRPLAEMYAEPESWFESVHPDDRHLLGDLFERRTSGGYDDEYRIIRPDGSLRWVHSRAFPIKDASGEIYRVAGVAEDVTDRKESELALVQNQERLQGIMDNATAVIFVKDRDGRYLLVNKHFEKNAGREAERIVGFTDFELFPEDAANAFRRHDLQVLTKGAPIQVEETLELGDGTHTFVTIKFPLFNGGSEPYAVCGVATDITELKELGDHLRQAQKMEAVGQLAGGVAHDFNNLLGVILNYANFIREELTDPGAVRKDVEEILKAAKRASDLTHQLLVFSRRQVVNPVSLDLNEVIRDVSRLLARTLGEHIELQADLDEKLKAVYADRVQIEQVLLNLAVNARDAMPSGGALTISTSNEIVDEDGEPSHVLLEVADTGEGMSPEIRDRAFEPFFTTKPTGQGTGMGLATVYGIATQAGGSVEIHSDEGSGTVVAIRLPISESEVAGEERGGIVDHEPGSGTVLIVEDEPGIRATTKRILARAGYDVLDVSTSAEALMLFELNEEPIDVLLTDVVMPQMSGIELAREIRDLHPDLPVVYMSGYPREVINTQGQLDGPLVEKPFTPEMLIEEISRAVAQRRRQR